MKRLAVLLLLALPAFPQAFGSANANRLRGRTIDTCVPSDGQVYAWSDALQKFTCSAVVGSVGETGPQGPPGFTINGTNCTGNQFAKGVDDQGNAEGCTNLPTTISGTANQITASASTGTIVLSIPTNPTLPGNTTGTFIGNVTGNASTATALAANGANCSAGNFPLGVDASGASESCTALPTTITGTANQITASASTGAITLSIPTNPTLPGTTTGTFSGSLTGNASTATALAGNPADCSSNQFANAIAANGDLSCAGVTASQVSGIPHPFGASFDGGGSAIAADKTAYFHLPYDCTVQATNILVDTGTLTFKMWKIAAGTAKPTVANVINTSGISISSGTNIRSTTLSDFTSTTVTARDIGAITLTAVSGATQATITLECQ
jgi:hypothetical protein